MHQSVVIDVIEGDLLPMHVQAAYHGHRDLLEFLKHFFLTHISSSVCAEGVPITCHLFMKIDEIVSFMKSNSLLVGPGS